jgi:hypothetical protein
MCTLSGIGKIYCASYYYYIPRISGDFCIVAPSGDRGSASAKNPWYPPGDGGAITLRTPDIRPVMKGAIVLQDTKYPDIHLVIEGAIALLQYPQDEYIMTARSIGV